MSLSVLDIIVILASQNELGCVLSDSIFWKRLWRNGVISFIKCLAEFSSEISWTCCFLKKIINYIGIKMT
jgi:hypothetical protein